MNKQMNPWLGWNSYTEESLSQGYGFVGRTSEISELFSLIDNNLIVTMYGKSGIGKTSILNAGVFPSLIAADYIPVVCRCDSSDNIVRNIIEQIGSQCTVKRQDGDISSCSGLLDFFSCNRFAKDGREVFPVLVFDQFEDWFRINKSAVESILSEMSYMVSNDYDGTTNYRFVITIREDYLYLLEDVIDRANLFYLKQNRFRLTHLTLGQAKEIVALGSVESHVAARLLELSEDDAGYNPGLLSFFCHELYEICQGTITNSVLPYLRDEVILINAYYLRCFENANVSASTKDYIETHFQEDGLRRPLNLNNVASRIPVRELDTLMTGNNKLLQKFPVGEDEYVELLHDKIAEIINNRKIEQLERKRKITLIVALSIYMLGATCVVWNITKQTLPSIWALYSSDTMVTYLAGICGENQSVSERMILGKSLLYSQIMAMLFVVSILIYIIPRYICKFSYTNLEVRPAMMICLWGIATWILCSSWLLRRSVCSGTLLYMIGGWGVLMILSIIIKQLKLGKYGKTRQ